MVHNKKVDDESDGDSGSSAGQPEMLAHPSHEELLRKLEEAEKKAEQNWERVLRMQAEIENAQRRFERDKAQAHKFALEQCICELLPVIDNLERSLTVKAQANTQELAALYEGVNLTLKMFNSVLERFGVEQVNPELESFNPEYHQAVSTQADDTVAPGTVIKVLQKGYLLNKRLVRPALVIVSKAD